MEPPPPPPPLPSELAINLIFHWQAEPAQHGFIFDRDRSVIQCYLQAVDDVVGSMIVTDCQAQAEEAMGMAVARLKHEFLHILERITAAEDEYLNVNTSGPSYTSLSFSETISSTSMSTGSGVEYDHHHETSALILNEVGDLRSIAQRMISAGYLSEFIDIYTSIQKSFLCTHLRRSGIQKWSTSDMRRLVSDEFNMHMDRWIQASKVFFKILFPKEYKLSTQIFDAPFGDVCFSNTVKDAKVELMNFAEALINTRRTMEKLFKFLDLYDRLADFSVTLTEEAEPISGLCVQLVEVVREILSSFENSVINEASPIREKASGRIHPLTRK